MSQAPPHFVSQADLTDAQKRREREIQEAYARIGEEPPPKPAEEAYDPRPLYERLREARALQDERIEEMFKLRNQFRGLDESAMFSCLLNISEKLRLALVQAPKLVP